MPGHRCIGEEDSLAWGTLGEVEEAPLHSLWHFFPPLTTSSNISTPFSARATGLRLEVYAVIAWPSAVVKVSASSPTICWPRISQLSSVSVSPRNQWDTVVASLTWKGSYRKPSCRLQKRQRAAFLASPISSTLLQRCSSESRTAVGRQTC